MTGEDPVRDALREIKALNSSYNRGELDLQEWIVELEPWIERAEQAQQARSAEGSERSDPESS